MLLCRKLVRVPGSYSAPFFFLMFLKNSHSRMFSSFQGMNSSFLVSFLSVQNLSQTFRSDLVLSLVFVVLQYCSRQNQITHGKSKSLTATVLRWPTTVTAKANCSRQNQITHGKTKSLTAKPNSLTAKPNSLTAKPNSLTAKPNSVHRKSLGTGLERSRADDCSWN